jgi:hypothetical protein
LCATSKNDDQPSCSPDGKWFFYVDLIQNAYMKVPLSGGNSEPWLNAKAEAYGGFDVARDGKTAVLSTSDFKARTPAISLFSLEDGAIVEALRLRSGVA